MSPSVTDFKLSAKAPSWEPANKIYSKVEAAPVPVHGTIAGKLALIPCPHYCGTLMNARTFEYTSIYSALGVEQHVNVNMHYSGLHMGGAQVDLCFEHLIPFFAWSCSNNDRTPSLTQTHDR